MKKILLILTIAALTGACKKESTTSASPTTPTPAPPSSSTISNGAGTQVNNLHGVMQVQKFSVQGITAFAYQSRAAFNSTPQPLGFYYMMGGIYATTGVQAGVLKLNGKALLYDTSTPFQQNRYVDTTSNANYSSGATWELSANSSFSSFTTAVTRGYPGVSNIGFLPSNISKSAGFTVSFGASNFSNTDSIFVLLQGPGGFSPMKHLAGNATSATFSASDLSGLTAGNTTNMVVFGVNYSNLSVSGKNYVFTMENNIVGNVTVNP